MLYLEPALAVPNFHIAMQINTVYYHLERKLCFTNHGLFYYFLLGGYFPGLFIIKYFKLISMSVSKELCCYSALISVDNLVIIPTPWFETV